MESMWTSFPKSRKGSDHMYLPSDTDMLLSILNMKLRDLDIRFDELCEEEDLDAGEITEKLLSAGYSYDRKHNCFS